MMLSFEQNPVRPSSHFLIDSAFFKMRGDFESEPSPMTNELSSHFNPKPSDGLVGLNEGRLRIPHRTERTSAALRMLICEGIIASTGWSLPTKRFKNTGLRGHFEAELRL
jgi:hypothetical protein